MGRVHRDQDGGAGAEHIAVVAIVAAVIAGVWAIGLPGHVNAWGSYAVCALFSDDQECERPGDDGVKGSLARDEDAPPACTVEASSHHHRTTTDLLFRRNVDGDRFMVSELSDGTMIIVDTEYEGSGVVVGVGGEVPLGSNSKLSIAAGGSAVAIEEGGLVYHLTPEAYEAYADEVTRQAVDEYMHGPTGLRIGETALGADNINDAVRAIEYGDIVLEELQDRIESHATHDLYRTSGQVTVNASGSWKLLSGGVTVGGSAGSTLQVDRETGAAELTIDLTAESAAQLGVGMGIGGSGELSDARGGSITLSMDPDGDIVGVSSNLTFEVATSGFVGFDLSDIPGAPSGPEGVNWGTDLGWSAGKGSLVDLGFDLPVETASDRERIERLLQNPVSSATEAFAAAVDDGSAMLQGYELTETSDEASAAVRAVASLGVSDERTTRQLQLAHAVSYDPDNGLMHREECVR